MISAELKKFLQDKDNQTLINENTKESWKQIYRKVPLQLNGEFTQTMLEAGINDPAYILGYIPKYYFYKSKIDSYKIPSNVTSISDGAFAVCDSLTSIVIPEGVTKINDSVFYGCSNLTEIEIPSSVTSIGRDALKGCKSLTSIKYNGTKEQWRNIDKGDGWKVKVPATKVTCNDRIVVLTQYGMS